MKTKIEFTEEQLLILNEALVKLPFEKVVYLINDINAQISSQKMTPPIEQTKPKEEMSAAELGYTRSGSGVSL